MNDVTQGGPAAKAGLVNGDLITGFDGKPVPDDRALPRIVADTPIGKAVNIEVLRKGRKQTLKITVLKLADDAKPDKRRARRRPRRSRTSPSWRSWAYPWACWMRPRAPSSRSARRCRAWR